MKFLSHFVPVSLLSLGESPASQVLVSVFNHCLASIVRSLDFPHHIALVAASITAVIYLFYIKEISILKNTPEIHPHKINVT